MTAGPVSGRRGQHVEPDGRADIEVPEPPLWGPRTARSLRLSAVGAQRLPPELIHAMAWIRWAAAIVNGELLLIDAGKAQAIGAAALRAAGGEFDDEFPLSAWQAGAGASQLANLDEVLARAASTPPRVGKVSTPPAVHADDDVALGQSVDDVLPSAVHLAVSLRTSFGLLPALRQLRAVLKAKAQAFDRVLVPAAASRQPAAPATVGQALASCEARLALCEASLRHAVGALHSLAIGGAAEGTGTNTHPEFGARVAAVLAARLDLPLAPAANLFAAMAGHEALVAFHAALGTLAITLTRVAAETGAAAGAVAAAGPDRSQVEALTMVCAQVIGHDAAIRFAAGLGPLDAGRCPPLIAIDTLASLRLLGDAMHEFGQHSLNDLQPGASPPLTARPAGSPAASPPRPRGPASRVTLNEATMAPGAEFGDPPAPD